jgi:protein-ribulosamine 3-kinase
VADLPESVLDALRPHVGEVRQAEPVGGGCIANATRLDAERGRFFLKWSGGDAGRTFEAEAAGLRALRDANSPLFIPQPLDVQDATSEPGYLLMEWVEPGTRGATFWTDFGRGFAALHRHTSQSAPAEAGERYGFDRDNFIGRLPQHNDWRERWPDFFRTQRLEPQFALARKRGGWKSTWDVLADRLLERLDDLLPAEPHASVLHGDLWSGNFLAVSKPAPAKAGSRAALVDPATYFGHREADLAMTELFGGFDRRFYDAYRAAWPLESGYEERREVYNLYHLVNHLNHFGGSYAGGVERTLRRFG